MLVVSLTGGIACGKSVVASILTELGCYVHHSDEVAHQLMEPKKPAWKAIVSHFGAGILNPNKTINRTKLGAIVFSDEKERHFLNTLLHPLVFEKKKEMIQRLEKECNYKIFVSEAALTIEAGFTDFFDKIVLVYCQESVQVNRLIKREQISRKEAMNKIRSQMPPEEKKKHADYIIDTSSTLRSTIEQTEKVYRNLANDYELKMRNRLNRA